MMPDSILAKQKQTIKEKVVQGLIPKERGEKMLKLLEMKSKDGGKHNFADIIGD